METECRKVRKLKREHLWTLAVLGAVVIVGAGGAWKAAGLNGGPKGYKQMHGPLTGEDFADYLEANRRNFNSTVTDYDEMIRQYRELGERPIVELYMMGDDELDTDE